MTAYSPGLFPPLGSLAVYVEDPNEDLTLLDGFYRIEDAMKVDPLSIKGLVVTQEQYDALLRECGSEK